MLAFSSLCCFRAACSLTFLPFPSLLHCRTAYIWGYHMLLYQCLYCVLEPLNVSLSGCASTVRNMLDLRTFSVLVCLCGAGRYTYKGPGTPLLHWGRGRAFFDTTELGSFLLYHPWDSYPTSVVLCRGGRGVCRCDRLGVAPAATTSGSTRGGAH